MAQVEFEARTNQIHDELDRLATKRLDLLKSIIVVREMVKAIPPLPESEA
jgi:NADH:ubiquinone oxidoreductase subunit D